MAMTKSFPTQDPTGISITDTRRVIAGLMAKNADGTPRAGILPGAAPVLVTGTAGMTYNVGMFAAATVRVAGGVELVANDASTAIATTAAPSANSRIDVIWVKAQFIQHADAANTAVLGVTQGAAAAIPTKPVIPAGAMELATAEILSTTTATSTAVISQTAPFTAAAGGLVPFRNATEMNAWAAPEGAAARDLSSGALFNRVAGVWSRQEVVDTGWKTLVLNSGWSSYAGEPPKWRVQNGRLSMTGRVTGTTAATGPVGALPPEARAVSAGQPFAFIGWSDSHGIVMLFIGHADGTINVVQGSGQNRTGISLASITYPVG